MDKEEVLKRSRNEKSDEGLMNIENKGREKGTIASVCSLINYIKSVLG